MGSVEEVAQRRGDKRGRKENNEERTFSSGSGWRCGDFQGVGKPSGAMFESWNRLYCIVERERGRGMERVCRCPETQ